MWEKCTKFNEQNKQPTHRNTIQLPRIRTKLREVKISFSTQAYKKASNCLRPTTKSNLHHFSVIFIKSSSSTSRQLLFLMPSRITFADVTSAKWNVESDETTKLLNRNSRLALNRDVGAGLSVLECNLSEIETCTQLVARMWKTPPNWIQKVASPGFLVAEINSGDLYVCKFVNRLVYQGMSPCPIAILQGWC